jgi:hypothetical protein
MKAVCKVDDTHHSEHDREPQADQRQRRNGIDEIDCDDDS